ncbi:MAG TPA: hypothetical protein VKA74_03870 [Myxococcota bacterium]|nr:hypothetical protein [Myxococcota bacterium]
MDRELRNAWIRAAAKMGIGATLLIAAVGLRVLTAGSGSPQAEGAESRSPTVESEPRARQAEGSPAIAGSDPSRDPGPADVSGVSGEASLVSRLEASVRERLPSAGGSDSRQGDRVVACGLPDGRRFMRADDCSLRGGRVLP